MSVSFDRRDRRTHSCNIVAGAVAAILLGASPVQTHAQTQAVSVAVGAQSLASALEQLARQTNINILFQPDEVAGYEAPFPDERSKAGPRTFRR